MFVGHSNKTHGAVKAQNIDIRQVKFDDNLNLRFHGGAVVEGAVIRADTRDIPGMGFQIKEGGGIITPLVISKRASGDMVVLRGNRRTAGGQWILANDPDAREGTELHKVLTSRTPAIVFENLTDAEERTLVNDQAGQKPYLRSEVVRNVFAMQKNGQTFEQIASSAPEQFAQALGAQKQLAAYLAIPPEQHALRKQTLVKWLTGTLRTYWMNAYECGVQARKATLLSEMLNDGLLTKDDEKPYWLTTKDAQNRMKNLKKAKEEDDKAGQWNDVTGGPKMKELMDKYHQEDFNADGTLKEKVTPEKKGLTPGDITKMLAENTVKSSPVRAVLNAVKGEFTGNLADIDDKLMDMQLKESVVLQYLPVLKDGIVKDTIRAIFVANDNKALEAILVANSDALTSGK